MPALFVHQYYESVTCCQGLHHLREHSCVEAYSPQLPDNASCSKCGCGRREQERQEKLQRALEVQEADWINQAAQEGSEEEQEPASIPDELYCALCDNSFKCQNALVNH